MTLVKKFSAITSADTQTAGGKGANLGAMFTAGIPVPDGFVVLSGCYDQFFRMTGLDTRIGSFIQALNVNDLEATSELSDQIMEWIKQEPLPDDIAEIILEHFDQLSAPLVAVRSSASAEDAASTAWAGQLETYLGTTRANLLTNIRRCWASLFSPRALTYRFQNNLMTTTISVAVVVQKMVASEVSGVAFSVHPVSQDPDQMIIEAGFGLGEAVVSGIITPDSYVISKNSKEILEIYPSEQNKGIFLNQKGGNEWKEIPYNRSGALKLTPEQIKELAEIIIRIESYFQFPSDIEWAMKNGKFYILQCRPITTLTT